MRVVKLKRLMVNRNIPDLLRPSQQSSGIFSNASLDLPFAERKVLTDAISGKNLITFTRTSSGTYVGSDGVLQRATTNLLLRSEEFNDASWTKGNASIITNSIAAPNGTLTGAKLVEDTSNATHSARRSTSQTINTSPITFSVYVKAAERAYVGLAIQEATTFTRQANVNFDLANGTANAVSNIGGASASSTTITAVGNGWYRCTLTTTLGGTDTNVLSWIYISTSGGFTYTGNGTSGIYLWGAQLEQSSTVGEYIPTTSTINSAPRFDHNPTTGESLGLLVEEQRTNSIRNNTMVGAVAGTPGTNPTNWFVYVGSGTGVATSIVSTGVESGVTYVDIRFNGTPSASSTWSVINEPGNVIAAATGQSWTYSAWARISAGSSANVTSPAIFFDENQGSTYITGGFIATSYLTSTWQRYSATRTLSGGATVDRVNGGLRFSVTAGQAIDITLRIGLPQLEQGAFATSVIPTTTATATRSADVASITGTNFSSWYRQDEGTVFVSGFTTGTTGNGVLAQFDDTTASERLAVRRTQDTNRFNGLISDGGVTQASFALDGFNNATRGNGVIVYAINDANVAFNGTLGTPDTALTLPTPTQLIIGNGVASVYANGAIRRLCYWGQRLPNSTLQTLTQ